MEVTKKVPEKETVRQSSKKDLTDASQQLRQGRPSGGRVLAEKSVAARESISGKKAARDSSPPPKPPKKR